MLTQPTPTLGLSCTQQLTRVGPPAHALLEAEAAHQARQLISQHLWQGSQASCHLIEGPMAQLFNGRKQPCALCSPGLRSSTGAGQAATLPVTHLSRQGPPPPH